MRMIEEIVIKEAVKLRETLEAGGVTDRHEKLQPPRPSVEETMIGLEIEQLWIFEEEDGKKLPNGVKVLLLQRRQGIGCTFSGMRTVYVKGIHQ